MIITIKLQLNKQKVNIKIGLILSRKVLKASGSQKKYKMRRKTGETYKQMTERMKKQNTDLQDTMKKGWDGYEQRIGKAKILSFGIVQETKNILKV